MATKAVKDSGCHDVELSMRRKNFGAMEWQAVLAHSWHNSYPCQGKVRSDSYAAVDRRPSSPRLKGAGYQGVQIPLCSALHAVAAVVAAVLHRPAPQQG
jgi:hypothetical protein